MVPIYLDIVLQLIATKEVTKEEFVKYVEGLFKADKTICIYDSFMAKNPSVCIVNYTDFTTWHKAMEAKTKATLEGIKAGAKEVEIIA